ncbi:MAG: hypothetical protein Q9P14_14135 [candidate division KSB1 bacterium]|nr:hypothetical protein [candidate division KSB1 bacterium]
MTALQAFLKAQKEIWLRRGIVGFLYVFNVLMAAILTLPIGGRLDRLANKELANHLIDGFAVDYVIEYFQKYGDSFQAIIAMLIGVGLFYVLTNTFLAGGILGVLSREKRFRLRPFLHESANLFGRFVRLLFLSLVVLILLYFVFRLAVLSPLKNLADSANPDVRFQLQLLSILLVLLLIGFWNMLFDYAKIAIHSRDIGSVFVGFFSSMRFALRHPLQTIGLYFFELPHRRGAVCALPGSREPVQQYHSGFHLRASGRAATVHFVALVDENVVFLPANRCFISIAIRKRPFNWPGNRFQAFINKIESPGTGNPKVSP